MLQLLCRILVAYVANSNGCSHTSTVSFDLSWRPLFFLDGACMENRFGLVQIHYFLFFFSYPPRFAHCPLRKSLQFLSLLDLVHVLLIAIFLFENIIFNFILLWFFFLSQIWSSFFWLFFYLRWFIKLISFYVFILFQIFFY
jgi:hypothetical protein